MGLTAGGVVGVVGVVGGDVPGRGGIAQPPKVRARMRNKEATRYGTLILFITGFILAMGKG
jgi:hypothetical protein